MSTLLVLQICWQNHRLNLSGLLNIKVALYATITETTTAAAAKPLSQILPSHLNQSPSFHPQLKQYYIGLNRSYHNLTLQAEVTLFTKPLKESRSYIKFPSLEVLYKFD